MKQVTIEKQDHFGRGIAHLDQKIMFVERALPKETCQIEIVQSKKNYQLAQIVKLETSSIERCESICPYYSKCGGCELLHQTYSGQLRFKNQKIEEILTKYAQIDPKVIQPILASNPIRYRNKVTLHIEKDKIGYYEAKSHRLIEVSDCLLLDAQLVEVMQLLQEFIKDHHELKSAMIKVGRKTKEVMLAVTGKTNRDHLKQFFQNKVTTLLYNHKILFGRPYITSQVFNQTFEITEESFFQVNNDMIERLYQVVIELVQSLRSQEVLDLYCGTGTIGLLVSPFVQKVIGVEIVQEAVASAKRNKKRNHISNVSFIEGQVEKSLSILTKQIDTVIVDPPRSGLDSFTVQKLLEVRPQNVIYVSCDPMTLARDLNKLQKEYDVNLVRPVDMFPNTHHVESIVLLSCKSSDSVINGKWNLEKTIEKCR